MGQKLREKFRSGFPGAPLLAAVLCVLVLSVLLLVYPVVGVADNGTFVPVTSRLGLYQPDAAQDGNYFNSQYMRYQYYTEPQDEYFSSQMPFLQAAKLLDSIFTRGDGRFDIRFFAVILILYCAAGIALLTSYAAYNVKSRWLQYAIAVLAVFVFADIGYSAYFNSLYVDGIAYVSALCAVGCLLLLTQKRYSPYWLAAGFVFNTVVLAGSQPHNMPVGFILALVCLGLSSKWLWQKKAGDEKTTKAKASPQKAKKEYYTPVIMKRLFISAGAAVGVASILFAMAMPLLQDEAARYHAMTRGVLTNAEDPEKTLSFFGIDRDGELLANDTLYQRHPFVDVENPDLQETFLSRYKYRTIVAFYLQNPRRLASMINGGMQGVYNTFPPGVGIVREQSGTEPGARIPWLSPGNSIKQLVMPRTFGFFVIWMLVALALSWKNKPRTVVFAGIIWTAFIQLVLPVFLGGNTLFSRYFVLYNTLFDVINFVGVSSLVMILGNRAWAKRQKAQEK